MVVSGPMGSSEVEWAGKIWEDINSVANEPGSVMLVPLGSLEQHGEHMPTMTDSYFATAVATAGAEKICDDIPVMVTPPLWLGFSPYHMDLGGTITGKFEHLLSILQDVARSGIETGFSSIFFVNGHGGNDALTMAAVQTVSAYFGRDVEVLGVTYYYLAEPIMREIRDSELGGMSHAGEFETSLMMYLRPELVDKERITDVPRTERRGGFAQASKDFFEKGGGTGRSKPLTVYPLGGPEQAEERSSGVKGTPSVASREKGEVIFEFIRDEMADILEQIHTKHV